MFELCGTLFGLAAFNGITLPVSLPLAFYETLLDITPIGTEISDAWPEISRSLETIRKGEVTDIEMVYPLEANGLRLSVSSFAIPEIKGSKDGRLFISEASRIVHHVQQTTSGFRDTPPSENDDSSPLQVDIESVQDAFPGWRLVKASAPPQEVDQSNRIHYVEEYKDWLTQVSVLPQSVAFKRGFNRVVSDHSTTWLSASDFRSILEGSNHLDINELRRATTYDGYDPSSKYIQNFWRLVSSWPEDKQKQLVKFVTASERIPAGGAKNLTFRIQKYTPANMEYLPTSSTCFGILSLPKYSSMEVLDRKLGLALRYGLEGFGNG